MLRRLVPARLLPASERVRLTALYGLLLLLAGGGLVALVYVLVQQGLLGSVITAVRTAGPARPSQGPVVALPEFQPAQKLPPGALTAEELNTYRYTQNLSQVVTDTALHRLLVYSLIALAVFAVLSIALAWWMAGRVLRPVAVITETARRLSGANLHERIDLPGPPGELKRLADTFDGMLGRMEQLVSAQRRFAANAAHELRTPLAVQRAAAEIGLAGDPDPAKVARIRERLIGLAEESERMIEGLLLLAASEEGLEATEPVRLDRTAAAGLADAAEAAGARGVTVTAALGPLTVAGDPVLLEHLVGNLVGNAVRHNRDGGSLVVTTGPSGLTVTNTGPVIAPEDVPRLLEPFRRRAPRQGSPAEGVGLGLSIVAAIARAHGATLTAEANPAPGGGLTVHLSFPPDGGAA